MKAARSPLRHCRFEFASKRNGCYIGVASPQVVIRSDTAASWRRCHLERSSCMPAMSAGQAVVEALRLEGVRYIFGVVGSCYVEVLDALYGCSDIQFLGVRHEQVAAHM